MTPEELQKLNEVYEFMESLKASTTIPKDVDGAFRKRFENTQGVSVSSKDADSEDKSVDESGSSSYNVLTEPDIFLQVTISGTVYYIPAFT